MTSQSTRVASSALRSLLLRRWVLWAASAGFVLVQLQTFLVTLPSLNGQLDGLSILDVRIPYWRSAGVLPWSGEAAQAVMQRLGEAGRHEYLRFAIGPDLAFAVLITPAFFTAILARLYTSRIFLLGVLPGLFDMLENVAIALLLSDFPAQPPIAAIGPYASALKFAAIALMILLIAAALPFSPRPRRCGRQIRKSRCWKHSGP